MNIPEYKPPQGFYDRPYTYVYYPDDLPPQGSPGGTTTLNTGVAMNVGVNEDFFVLRQIKAANVRIGNPNAGTLADYATGFRFRDALGRDMASGLRPFFGGYSVTDTIGNVLIGGVWPIVPEVVYPRASSIVFDISGVKRGYNGAVASQTFLPPYYITSAGLQALSQIHFIGARRIKGTDPVLPALTEMDQREPQDYTYVVKVTVTTPSSGAVADVKQYFQTITGWHFELTDISIVGDIPASGSPGGSTRIKLFDSQKMPCSSSWLSSQAFNQLTQTVSNNTQTGTPQGMGAICPTLWYPDQSSILFEVQNILTGSSQSNTVTILFHGRKWQKKI